MHQQQSFGSVEGLVYTIRQIAGKTYFISSRNKFKTQFIFFNHRSAGLLGFVIQYNQPKGLISQTSHFLIKKHFKIPFVSQNNYILLMIVTSCLQCCNSLLCGNKVRFLFHAKQLLFAVFQLPSVPSQEEQLCIELSTGSHKSLKSMFSAQFFKGFWFLRQI